MAGLVTAASSAGLSTWATHTHSAPAPTTTTTSAAASSQGRPSSGGSGFTAVYLPDPTLHPGAVDAALGTSELCAAGFTTKSIRPPVSYTSKLKDLELGSGGQITAPSGTVYTVVGENLPGTVADYELDHLVSLEIGGNPEDPKNLWMQPWENRGPDHLAPPGRGAESKDVLENRLHREVCAGTIALADAQREIATDWTTAH